MTDRHIRFSDTQAYKWCRRNWLNSRYYGLTKPSRPDEPAGGQRDVGTIIDRAIRHYYFDGDRPTETVERLKDEYLRDFRETFGAETEFGKGWDDAFLLAWRMAESYEQWIEQTGADAGEVTVGTEVEFAVRMPDVNGDRVFLHIHVDRLVLDTMFNEFIIEDTKTVQSLDKGEEFQVDDQLLTYSVVIRLALGLEIRRARHNMIRKVLRSTSRAKPPFVGRIEVEFTEDQQNAHYAHLVGVLTDMVLTMQSLDRDPGSHHHVAYPSPGRDCTWRCDFLPICVAHDDGTDIEAMRDGLYVPYPERTPSGS